MNYDIFISYKCSDENGNKTEDFYIAKKLFDTLTKSGFKTFFSSETLEKLGSSRFKSDIDTALDSAKIMIVVLSKAEYASSKWVQYEWESFYEDYLSNARKEANLFTLTSNVDISNLPRTLRFVQNFNYENNFSHLCEHVKNALSKLAAKEIKTAKKYADTKFYIINGREITEDDIIQASLLDKIVYDDCYIADLSLCKEWFRVNPDIYVMAKEKETDKVIAYINILPITEECYHTLKNGDFIDTALTTDMILTYEMPSPYIVYFASIVIHPVYQNTEVLLELFNAIVNKFIGFGKREIFIQKMLADAVTKNGEKFCKLFGMEKIKDSSHASTLYEINLIPPKFRIVSKSTKELYDYYLKKYKESPYLFSE